jgi:hypothetical protein
MSLSAIVVVLSILQLHLVACSENLHLLALVPQGKVNETSCLDRGDELIPAAEIAAASINSNPNLLADFNLTIIPADTDQCSDPSIAKALGSFANFTTNKRLNVVGMIGLMCSSPLLRLSNIASLPVVDILHITSSTTSPSIVNTFRMDGVGRLYQIAPSSALLNEAVVALMKTYSWRSISVIRRADSVSIEHDHIASDFQEKIMQDDELKIAMYAEAASGLERFIQDVKLSGVRIIYASVTNPEARDLICFSYMNNVSWPNYVWIFHDFSIGSLLLNTTDCSGEIMHKALEGVVLLHHYINSDSDREIDHVNYTYGEYYAQYTERLQNITSQPICNEEPQILSANALHDSVIAFAYALNKSLDSDISCLGTLGHEDCQATKVVDANLRLLNFRGAGGEVSFDNTTHELIANSQVNIYQVSNGSLSLLTKFSDGVINERANSLSNISYTFERTIFHLPLALPVITLVVIGLCITITLITFIFFVVYRNSLEIKATSPLLSHISLSACFLLYISAAATAAKHGFASGQIYANLCASEQFFFVLGVQLIFATLFVRLLRVSRIFFNLDPIGKAWSDKYLALYISAIVLVSLFLSVLWLSIGNFQVGMREEFISGADPPYFSVHLTCDAEYTPVFLSLIWGYAGLLMLLVVILAIKTRKVTIDIFKDTKSVNAFVFCSVGIFALFVPIAIITASFTSLAAMILSYLFQVASVIVVAMACISFLFLPKIYSAVFATPASRSASTLKSANNKSSFQRSYTA